MILGQDNILNNLVCSNADLFSFEEKDSVDKISAKDEIISAAAAVCLKNKSISENENSVDPKNKKLAEDLLKKGFDSYYNLKNLGSISKEEYWHAIARTFGFFSAAVGYYPVLKSKCKREFCEISFILGFHGYKNLQHEYEKLKEGRLQGRLIASVNGTRAFFHQAVELNPELAHQCAQELADSYYIEAMVVYDPMVKCKDQLFDKPEYRWAELARKHINIVDKALELNPNHSEAYLLKARINVVLNYNRFTDLLAIENYTIYLEKNPEDWEIYYERAKACVAFEKRPQPKQKCFRIPRKLNEIVLSNCNDKSKYRAPSILEESTQEFINNHFAKCVSKDVLLAAQNGHLASQNELKKLGYDWRLVKF